MLKPLKLNKSYTSKALLMFMMLYLVFALSCGKRKPPLPPVERIPQKAEIQGIQRGDSVLITWILPARNASKGDVLNIDRVDIYRYAEPSNLKLTLTADEFASKSTLISSEKVSKEDFGLKPQIYSDKLQFADQPIRLIYAVRFVNSAGQKADFSNFLLIETSSKVASPPNSLKVEITEPAIVLNWSSPESNIDKTTPVNILGYNIYRKNPDSEEFQLLNEAPVNGQKFSDERFEFEKSYQYFVRTVSIGVEGEPIESLDSNLVEVLPKDIFPPSAPSAITIAAAPNNLSIFFATNPETDIKGYRIYRSTDKDTPLSEWETLTPEIINTNTFQDTNIRSGQTYYYYIVAIDNFGNQSRASEIVFETAP